MGFGSFELVPIGAECFIVGEPAPVAVYDDYGRLLLAKGAVLQSDRQKEILFRVGKVARQPGYNSLATAISDPDADIPRPYHYPERINPFNELLALGARLRELFLSASARPTALSTFDKDDFIKELLDIAMRVQGLCHHDNDAMIGAAHLQRTLPYPILHGLRSAILVESVMERLCLPQAQRVSTLGAALSANIAMVPYQERLHQQKAPLSDQQRAIVAKHPAQSVKILESLGITDEVWLAAVAQHHERWNGSGYPNGLKEASIVSEARLLAVVDTYAAILHPMPFRTVRNHSEAFKYLAGERDQTLDRYWVREFIHTLTHYPPGVFVSLHNGELACVVGRSRDPHSPLVASLRTGAGAEFFAPRRRNTLNTEFKISALAAAPDNMNLTLAALWGIETP